MEDPSLPNLDRLLLSSLRCRIVCIGSPKGGIVGICPSSGRNVCDWHPRHRKICVGSWRLWRCDRIMTQEISDLACRQISATNTNSGQAGARSAALSMRAMRICLSPFWTLEYFGAIEFALVVSQ